ncbi:predicted protein [Histoplasma capsulatum G186AR]|uniref:VOC domain-containing protein n=2 Tax=Ajellomyces capsulatus TaxID=5037 RepID=C0NZN5_AJECG|nr:uncharacterized protein HCBG_08615 [Histoplasma capsulatum G186AR]EEH03283.1 predicted protein [Histoplasma capsulatum G186AR]KAG5290309.1 glyoxalase, conidia-enriched transcript [Histoplasma capsulatum]QSS72236.1 glyoxalase, conidia-enriched transcript [Histoplasma capsulatum G186AR]
MASSWTPPPFGAPCWVNVPVTDMARAKSFYTKVFNWDILPQPANLDEKQIVLFSFPKSDSSPNAFCGSFERVEAAAHTKSDNGYKMYFMVEDDQKTAEAIIANGGAKLSDPVPEGDHGFITQCRDSEGNCIGIYVMKKACS